ncbi:LIF receptor subunit alpha a isoform X1 [Astyanax mexicanus]|uniref:LIF receptor subunit alpha a isoform X1 n=3 Tax=Astyanax mexicanus TaxID=7994 RepID=UPI0020CAEF02|nr:LIF receptor subunit alpha a isoform X1 [Astyanax mexicanus]
MLLKLWIHQNTIRAALQSVSAWSPWSVVIMQEYTALLVLLTFHLTHCLTHAGPAVPRSVSVQQDVSSQSLLVTWESDSALFDIEILRTELMENVFNDTVSAVVDPVSGRRGWTWSSVVPLQCTSHSVRIRAREQEEVSEWSPLQTIAGSDVPDRDEAQMYPQDAVVAVGSNLTLCCIAPERQQFDSIQYKHLKLQVTMLSRRSFAATVTNLPKSISTGTNIICCSKSTTILTGTVVFSGYPPGDKDLQCETRDLQGAECSWSMGRDTGFWRKKLLTTYTLNGRRCEEVKREEKRCVFDHWENSWTLTAANTLGSVQLNDSAPITDRVRPVAPVNMVAVAQAWNSSLQWNWTLQAYKTLDMICEVQITTGGRSDTRNFSGVGLSEVLLDGLMPDVQYSLSVRCGSRLRFWRWGDCSAPYSIHTLMDRPEALDVWVYRDSETTGQILWKSLSVRDSHGALVAYEVYQKDGEEEDGWRILSLPPSVSSLSITLSNSSSDVIVAVAARNPAGLSLRSVLVVPEFQAGSQQGVSELVGTDGRVDVSWRHANASGGYVVEWVPAACADHCAVQWIRVPQLNSSTIMQPGSLEAGVQYTLSVFAVCDVGTDLVERYQVYGQELVPSHSVKGLSALQSGQNVLLSWSPVDISNQRGFIRGYSIYLTKPSQLQLIANVTDPAARAYTVPGLSLGSYKFTVKAYTSAGEGGGATVAIKIESNSDMLVMQIMVALGVMSFTLIVVSAFCYRKREWVKKAFYPEIPGPKLTGDWSAPPAPLDVKPPPHSLVHIVESPEWKAGLFPVPEEEESYDNGDENVEADTDSDEPALLRYYNQLVTDGSHSGQSDTSGSSTGSVDSAQTQVTYTGIQSPTPSQWTPAHGYRPQMQPAEGREEPGAGLETGAEPESPGVGYKPQCSWQPDSPGAENFGGCLGSPTSVTSSQFLIPETAEDHPEPSGTWFQNLLSGKF